MDKWFEITVKAEIDNVENGKKKVVTERHMVDALSYTEAEARAIELFSGMYSGFEIKRINPVNVSEIFFNPADFWYKCKVNYITINEKTGAERKSPCYMYVQAGNPKDAEATLVAGMSGTMGDWNCESIVETKIINVFKYDLEKEVRMLETKNVSGES